MTGARGRKIYSVAPLLPVLLLLLGVGFFWDFRGELPTRSMQALWNYGHLVFFALLSLYLLLAVPRLRRLPLAGQALGLALLVLCIGGGIELIQGHSAGRSASVGDVYRDMAGAMLAVAFFTARDAWPAQSLLRAVRGLSLAVALLLALPVFTALYDEYRQRQDFPLLSGFESPLELGRWQGSAEFSLARQHVARGDAALKVAFGTEQFSEIGMHYFPRDWRLFQALAMQVFNPQSQPLALTLRVHDRHHERGLQAHEDRFNRSYSIKPGWNQLRVALRDVAQAPRGRAMDLGEVAKVILFTVNLERSQVLYLDQLTLEQ